MGPGILSSIGVGVWRNAPMAFPDPNAALDTFQSAKRRTLPSYSRQITYLVSVRLKHLLYDFFWWCFGFYIRKQQEGGQKTPPKSHIANVLGGHRLDE